MNVLPQVDPEIFFFDVAKILTGAPQDALAIAVDGVSLDIARGGTGFGSDAILQLPGRVAHVGNAQDLPGSGKVGADKPRDALHQDAGLPSAGAGNDQHGATFVLDGELLFRIGGE